jgi:enoyl-CoA hydratase
MGIDVRRLDGSLAPVAEVVIDVPPVNALPAGAWFELADTLGALGADESVAAMVLRAEGRGFCAGVDVKELARGGASALVEVNRGCAAAFSAIYGCPIPVIVAVHGFCLGGGVGLVGSADVVVASEDATFGLPEVDRGALGAATHLARLVPPARARWMLLSAESVPAEELARFGSVLEVVPRTRLRERALELASRLASKSPTVLRRAKESLNAIDPVDPRRSYRMEQGFTFELQLTGVAEEHRRAFVERRPADTSR